MSPKSLLFALTATVWALAAGTAVFWFLQQVRLPNQAASDMRQQAKVVIAEAPHSNLQVDAAELATLLGHTGTEIIPALASRFKLWGVVAQTGGGAALLALDDQPARPYRVGSRLGETTLLQSIGPRHVMLGSALPGSHAQRLDLPAK